jgi:predicted deacylase
MRQDIEIVSGDTPGAEWRLPVLRFGGARPDGAPSAYLQAALHGGELPGVATLHVLAERLRAAEARGDILGDVALVPVANPIGMGQFLFGNSQGRFDLGTRINFNRAHPVLATADRAALAADGAAATADVRLKARLVGLALGSEIVLDLHCDEESLPYLYVHAALWPATADLAAALGAEAVLTWDGDGGAAFEEAALAPHLADVDGLAGRAVATVELRGLTDVTHGFAEADAEGLMRFLAERGVVAGPPAAPGWTGPVAPLEFVEMVRAPAGGVLLYHVGPGDRVEEGEAVATLIARPGELGGAVPIAAPQGGLVLTRRDRRMVRPGEDVMKIVGSRRSPAAKPGPLEP